MTTPHENPDPFAAPTADAPSGVGAPAPMAPPGYAQTPPGYPSQPGYPQPGGYAPIMVAPQSAPRAVAMWAIVLTGAYATVSLLSATFAPATVESLKSSLADPENASAFAGTNPIDFLSLPIAVASYVLLALWMWKIRNARKARGEAIGGPPAVEWWGWFVPLANIVLPFLGMRAITKGRASIGHLLGWWLPYIGASILAAAASLSSLRAIDFTTGELTNPDALDSMVGLSWASAIAMVVSWAFLAIIIRTTTRREDDAR